MNNYLVQLDYNMITYVTICDYLRLGYLSPWISYVAVYLDYIPSPIQGLAKKTFGSSLDIPF
jgi:hypothetical protein